MPSCHVPGRKRELPDEPVGDHCLQKWAGMQNRDLESQRRNGNNGAVTSQIKAAVRAKWDQCAVCSAWCL